jgi:hypothetical protein
MEQPGSPNKRPPARLARSSPGHSLSAYRGPGHSCSLRNAQMLVSTSYGTVLRGTRQGERLSLKQAAFSGVPPHRLSQSLVGGLAASAAKNRGPRSCAWENPGLGCGSMCCCHQNTRPYISKIAGDRIVRRSCEIRSSYRCGATAQLASEYQKSAYAATRGDARAQTRAVSPILLLKSFAAPLHEPCPIACRRQQPASRTHQ